MDSIEREAKKALMRLRRALEKAQREVDTLAGTIRHAEGSDFPVDAYATAEEQMEALVTFVDEEAERLQEKILHAGGLEPGRVRRGSSA